MKEKFKQLLAKVDALSVRERAILFLLATGVLFVIADTTYLTPLLRQQREFARKATDDQQQIQAMQAEIQIRIQSQTADPDVALRNKLQSLRKQSADLKAELLGMQKGLVSPDKMAVVLEDILRRNGRLRLISLKTIPVAPLIDPVPEPKPAAGAAPKTDVSKTEAPKQMPLGTVYKHTVEMTVEGSYLDMMAYLSQLENMPWQLFWGKAQLEVKDNAKPTLTLTLFTLSLDETWLNI